MKKLSRQARPDEQIRRNEQADENEPKHAAGPGEANLRKQRLHQQRIDDAAKRAPRGSDAGGVAAPDEKEVSDRRHRGREDEGEADAGHDAPDEHEVVVLCPGFGILSAGCPALASYKLYFFKVKIEIYNGDGSRNEGVNAHPRKSQAETAPPSSARCPPAPARAARARRTAARPARRERRRER